MRYASCMQSSLCPCSRVFFISRWRLRAISHTSQGPWPWNGEDPWLSSKGRTIGNGLPNSLNFLVYRGYKFIVTHARHLGFQGRVQTPREGCSSKTRGRVEFVRDRKVWEVPRSWRVSKYIVIQNIDSVMICSCVQAWGGYWEFQESVGLIGDSATTMLSFKFIFIYYSWFFFVID